MNRLLFSSVLTALLLLAAFNVMGQEQAPAPVYKEGDFWQFRLGKRPIEATIKDGKLRFFEPKPDQRTELDVEKFPMLKNMLAVEPDEQKFLEFPLFVGKDWSNSYQDHLRGFAGLSSIPARTSVTAVEEITTSAGTFRAFKIERSEALSGPAARMKPVAGQTLGRTYRYYYSPETRSIVKYNFTGRSGNTIEIELLRFGSRN
jgi:hypothetical protein